MQQEKTMDNKFYTCENINIFGYMGAPRGGGGFNNQTGPILVHIYPLFNNKATRSPEISREQVQKLTPQFLLYLYIGYRFPLSLSTIWGNHLPVNFMLKFPTLYLRFGETTSPI